MGELKQKKDFTTFKKVVQNEVNQKSRRSPRTPLTARAYSRWGYSDQNPVGDDFTLEEIKDIIRSGDLVALRQLSSYFYRVSSNYRQNIDFLANLPLYDTVVIPVYPEGKGSKAQIINAFFNACDFVDKLDLPNTLSRITKEWLKTGVYNGLIRFDGDNVTIQDLPLDFCRSRFKDYNNLSILEFNLLYFSRITDDELREEAIASFPEIIRQAWRLWEQHKINSPWVEIPASQGGISFSFVGDCTPPLIASIPELKKLDDATSREGKRDENELYKLLIQEMPVDSDGELVFQLEEVAEIHSSVAEMLRDTDTVDVLTTFGDTHLESLQETSAASQSNDRLEKYRKNVWDSLGRSEILFNAEGSSSLAYGIKKDEALMINYLNAYETWIKYLLNQYFSRPNLTFDFEILPTTVFNRADIQNSYFRSAQYGYSKMYAGVAMGIKQRSQLSLMNFENDFLKMSEKMVPLQSSYTTPGGTIANEEKNNSSGENTEKSTKPRDLDDKGGRPELPDEQKSEKTQANIAAQG